MNSLWDFPTIIKEVVKVNRFEFPESYQPVLEELIANCGQSLREPKKLARYVQSLSEAYITRSNPNPWSTKSSTAAYLAYFFPLNYLRVRRALQQSRAAGFSIEVERVIDFGAGCGSATWALLDELDEFSPKHIYFIERSPQARGLIEAFLEAHNFSGRYEFTDQLSSQAIESADLVMSSYSINELGKSVDFLFETSRGLIIEPSSQNESRELMGLRADLIDKGYSIQAPCTHQLSCPLLKHSKRDWCHDRIHIEKPQWLEALEAHLPMTNNSLTFSYLAYSNQRSEQNERLARVIGDTLQEKGKTRQALCRNDQREFLSWLKRDGKPQFLEHGQLIRMREDYENKGNELRIKSKIESV